MRSVLSFFSLVAFGILLVGVASVVASGSAWQGASLRELSFEHIHAGSLMAGVVIGWVLSAMTRVAWGELPGRLAHFLMRHEGAFYRLAIAGLLVAVLVYY